jgi:hypothetical protein
MEDVIQKLKGHSTQAVRECITKGENGWKNLSLFSLVYFFIWSVTGNEKIKNGIQPVKSGLSKTDKSKQKCLGIDRQTVI